jgi:hypothetical protein
VEPVRALGELSTDGISRGRSVEAAMHPHRLESHGKGGQTAYRSVVPVGGREPGHNAAHRHRDHRPNRPVVRFDSQRSNSCSADHSYPIDAIASLTR